MTKAYEEDRSSDSSWRIHTQYEAWPYPQIPIVGSVRRTDTWQINLSYLKNRCGLGPPPPRPRMLLVGCGTFQPYVFALANPNAEILATDISEKSLHLARLRNRVHGITHVRYQRLDLNDPGAYPDGLFDYIECYGVLMNLDAPEKTLKELAARLTPEGIIRIMVYPHFSRGRIVQIQRLAKRLGLHFQDRSHPRLLRNVIRALPREHPLRYAFTTYRDSQNDPGIVDGFLHAGDRCFTGYQLGKLVSKAGLRPAFYFHRSWGQPDIMAQSLNLPDWNDAMILHYLDLWQELRTNFVVCLVRDTLSPIRSSQALRPHPLLQLRSGPLRHRLTLRLHSLVGMTLPSRTTADPIKLSGQALRSLSQPAHIPPDCREEWAQLGILLGPHAYGPSSRQQGWIPNVEPIPASSSIALGAHVPNPFYEHLFQAYLFERDVRPPGLVSLAEQIEQWRPMADPLEDEGAWGLTPFGTYLHGSEEILPFVTLPSVAETVSDFDHVRFKEESLEQVVSFLKKFPDLPKVSWSEARLRELWILIFSYPHLFLESSRIPFPLQPASSGG